MGSGAGGQMTLNVRAMFVYLSQNVEQIIDKARVAYINIYIHTICVHPQFMWLLLQKHSNRTEKDKCDLYELITKCSTRWSRLSLSYGTSENISLCDDELWCEMTTQQREGFSFRLYDSGANRAVLAISLMAKPLISVSNVLRLIWKLNLSLITQHFIRVMFL